MTTTQTSLVNLTNLEVAVATSLSAEVHEGQIVPMKEKSNLRGYKKAAWLAHNAKKKAERVVAMEAKATAKEAAKNAKLAHSDSAMHVAEKFLQDGDAIALHEANYHEHYIKSADQALYKLLQVIMAFIETIIASGHEKECVGLMRFRLKHVHHIITQKNTPTASVVVRYVIRTSRKNACVYSRVINQALADGIKSNDLVKYIEDHQGISNIRKAITPKVKKDKELGEQELKNIKLMALMGESYLANRSKAKTGLSKFKLDQKHSSMMIDASRFSSFKYFACDYVDGEYVVIDVVPMDEEFELKLLERITNYRVGYCSLYSQEEADALELAAMQNGLKIKKKLSITSTR